MYPALQHEAREAVPRRVARVMKKSETLSAFVAKGAAVPRVLAFAPWCGHRVAKLVVVGRRAGL